MNAIDEPWIVDNPPSERYPIYTRANVGEIYPHPATPFVWTTCAGPQTETAWREGLVRFGAFDHHEFDPDNNELTGVFYGYVFLNVSVSRVFGVRMPGGSADLVDRSFFGEQPGVPPYEPVPADVSPVHTERIGQTLQRLLTVDALPDLDDDKRAAAELRAARPDLASMSNRQLLEYATPVLIDRFVELMTKHFFILYASTVPSGMVDAIVTPLDSQLVVRVMSGLGDVDSAAPSWEMWDLGRLVRESPELTDEFDRGVAGLLDRLRADPTGAVPGFLARFDEFLREFGARGPDEFNMAAPTWETQPELPLGFIDRMRLADAADAPQKRLAQLHEDRQEAIQAVLERLAGDEAAVAQFRMALHAIDVWLPARERSKTTVVRVLNEGRMAVQEIAKRMAAQGHLSQPEDFSMLTLAELEQFIDEPAVWTETIRSRRARYEELRTLEPPFIVVGSPPPPSSWRRRIDEDRAAADVGETLPGISACPGTASGTVRVVMDPSDAASLQPGDVLVAPFTDPSWTPLFVGAEAVVVDVGAQLSHAAIVSRELGVPCVVSCTDATKRLRNGMHVTVDGAAGTVTVDALAG